MKRHVIGWALGAVGFGLACQDVQAAFVAVGTYDSTTNSNVVDSSAAAAPNDVTSFSTAVATAFPLGNSGVVTFDSGSGTLTGTSASVIDATYGSTASPNSKSLRVTSSTPLEIYTALSNSSFTPISGSQNVFPGVGSDRETISTFRLDFGPITNGSVDEGVLKAGVTFLSRNTTSFPKTITMLGDVQRWLDADHQRFAEQQQGWRRHLFRRHRPGFRFC